MTHPFEIAIAVAVVAAIGAGTMLVLPRPKPDPPAQTVVLEIAPPGVVRAEPQAIKSDAERVADLERQLSAIGADQRALAEDLRAALRARSSRKTGRKETGPKETRR